MSIRRLLALLLLALALPLCPSPANAQDPTTQDMSAATVSMSPTLDPAVEGFCESPAVTRVGHVTVRRYQGGQADVSTEDPVLKVRGRLQGLSTRIGQLETRLSQLLMGGTDDDTDDGTENDGPPRQRIRGKAVKSLQIN